MSAKSKLAFWLNLLRFSPTNIYHQIKSGDFNAINVNDHDPKRRQKADCDFQMTQRDQEPAFSLISTACSMDTTIRFGDIIEVDQNGNEKIKLPASALTGEKWKKKQTNDHVMVYEKMIKKKIDDGEAKKLAKLKIEITASKQHGVQWNYVIWNSNDLNVKAGSHLRLPIRVNMRERNAHAVKHGVNSGLQINDDAAKSKSKLKLKSKHVQVDNVDMVIPINSMLQATAMRDGTRISVMRPVMKAAMEVILNMKAVYVGTGGNTSGFDINVCLPDGRNDIYKHEVSLHLSGNDTDSQVKSTVECQSQNGTVTSTIEHVPAP